MALAYLFALIVGLGILLLQAVLGGKDKGDAGDAAQKELDADDAIAPDLDGGAASTIGDFAALFLTTRFWIFALLAFGLTGSLLHWFDLAAPPVAAALSSAMGLASGLFAAYSLRALRRASTTTNAHVAEAVGQVGRVLVPLQKGALGQIRIQLKGQTVDLAATTDEIELARGEAILIEEIDGSVARVCRRPAELE